MFPFKKNQDHQEEPARPDQSHQVHSSASLLLFDLHNPSVSLVGVVNILVGFSLAELVAPSCLLVDFYAPQVYHRLILEQSVYF